MDIIDKLPLDIVRYIIPFTYNVQSKTLLEEIKWYFRVTKHYHVIIKKNFIIYTEKR